jgi:hypothetical protein
MIVVDNKNLAWSDYDDIVMPRPVVDLLTKCKKKGRHPGALLVTNNSIKLLLHLQKEFKDHPEWNFKLSIHDKDSFVNGVIRTYQEDATVSFFGFRDAKSRNTWYYYVISPQRYTRSSLNELVPGNEPEISKLYEWGQSLYEFAQNNGLKPSGSAGGLASQLLRDKRFYPADRRKVPVATNEKAREALPGNHYEFRGTYKRVYASAIYYDQENAHHWAAGNLELPYADWLYARGYFHGEKREWCTPGSPEYQHVVENEHGLLHARVWVPKRIQDSYLPPWAGRSGLQDAYIYTNELPLLKSLGVEIRYLYAAWTSPIVDKGLPKYSKWAREQIRKHPHNKLWLKSVLLATYGVLASKPRLYEFGYYRANGKSQSFNLGPHEIHIVRTSTKKKNQLPIANVIHRGMIEAETRKLSIELARQFEDEGHTVLSIYADGVIVKDNERQFPLVPKPWRAKHKLRYLAFTDTTSFESELLRKMPGRKRLDKPVFA